jgi:large subunit ribosomal protein L23
MDLKDVLKRPIITEKSMQGEIKRAVREYFDVNPVSVRTINVRGSLGWARGFRKKVKSPSWKKAIVTLKEGEKIEIFEVGE